MTNAQVFLSHSERMSRYYRFQSKIYDATRWMFLYGRKQIIRELIIRPGETVLEIGCGTGRNFSDIVRRLEGRGSLIAVDCSKPMLARAVNRARSNKWLNVEFIDLEYGSAPVTAGKVDVVLFSYSLSMISNWQQALKCAKAELKPGGRIGIVDFELGKGNGSEVFGDWLRFNHVESDRPYETVLTSLFETRRYNTAASLGGLWNYFLFSGCREDRKTSQPTRRPNEG